MSTPSAFGKDQARALLELLQVQKDEDVQRIYFVDVDILSTYIDAKNGDILSDWSSLFSLTPESKPLRGDPIDETSRVLADAMARAVSGFLMGPFRQGLKSQGSRFWLTPEHEQELDNMIHAVIEGGHEPIARWHQTLADLYLSLPDADPSENGLTSRLEEIFTQLRVTAAVGKVARTYGVKRQFTTSANRTAVFPPTDLGRAFAVSTETSEHQRRVAKIARTALDFLMGHVQRRQRSTELMPAIRQLHDLAFVWHAEEISNREITSRALRDSTLRSLLRADDAAVERWIRTSTRIAAAEVADAFSLARIVALSELLNDRNPLRQPFRWKVCILTGASKPGQMLAGLRSTSEILGMDVEIVHPLSVMQFDEFLSPRHRPKEQSESMQMLGREYALGVLKDPKKVGERLDSDRFLFSLTQLLTQASAAFAHFDDRSLDSLRGIIQANADYSKIVRAIGNAVSSRFIDTYVQLNAVAQPEKGKLPAINLPWLSMPHPEHKRSPAEEWVELLHADVHGASKAKSSETSAFDIQKLLRSDATGYSATLCAALGYLAMGQRMLSSAENAANTAARNALIGSGAIVPGEYVPEGNEALYLSAFISRMRVKPDPGQRRSAFEWRDAHIALMDKARERMEKWELNQSAITRRPLPDGKCTLADLVYWRYDIENAARDVYCLLIDGFAPTSSMDTADDLAALPQGSLFGGSFSNLVTLMSTVHNGLTKIGHDKTPTEVGFARAQLLATAIQCWLCERLHLELIDQRPKSPTGLERLVEQILDSAQSDLDGSQLLKLLISVFDRHRNSLRRPRRNAESSRPHPANAMNKFAEIDSLRDRILRSLQMADPKNNLIVALEASGIPFKPAERLQFSA